MRKKNPDIDTGWAWLVLVAVFLGIIILSTTMFMGGVLYVAFLDHFDAGEAKTSLIGALNGGLLCLLGKVLVRAASLRRLKQAPKINVSGPLASLLMTTFSCRICMFVGGILSALSCLTSAFVGSVDILILTYGIIGGIGNCFTSTPFVVVLGYYFDKRRNIVIAISQAVIGVGFFLASPLALIIINNFGLRGTFLILGGINAHLCIIAIICKPSSIEKRIFLAKTSRKDLQTKESDLYDETMVDLLEKDIIIETEINSETFEIKLAAGDDVNRKLKKLDTDEVSKEFCKHKQEVAVDKSNGSPHLSKPGSQNGQIEMELAVVQDNIQNADMNSEPEAIFEVKTVSNLKTQNYEKRYNCASSTCSLHLIGDMPFVMFLLSTLTWNFTLSMCIMHLPNYMTVKGADGVAVAGIMTCFSASNLSGRFIGAMTVGKGGIDSLTLHVGMLGVAGIVTLLFPFYSGTVGDYIFVTAIGLYTGGPNSIMTPITLKMVRIEDLSVAHGLEHFFSGLGYVPGPFVAGLLYSLSGAYETSFITGGCILLVGCLLAMISAIKTSKTAKISK